MPLSMMWRNVSHLCLGAVLVFLVADSAYSQETRLDLTAGAGRRNDNLNWNIAGNTAGTGPNILSELQWTDLEIFELKTSMKYSMGPVHIKGALDHGWIQDGRNQDSDYLGDDRTLEFSRSNNKADRGSVWDASLGAGYTKRIFYEETRYGTGSIDITPMAGYSFHRQSLTMTDGFQTIDTLNDPPQLGPIANLDSKYKARWYGPWAGLGVALKINFLTISWTGEYHWAEYRGDLYWNLRGDLAQPKNGEDKANGSGVVNSLNIGYALSESWALNGAFDYQRWKTSAGTQTTFFADGSTEKTRLNEVNWESEAFTLGITYSF